MYAAKNDVVCLNAWVTITAAAENNATTYADIPERDI